jgi:hypothetical protein
MLLTISRTICLLALVSAGCAQPLRVETEARPGGGIRLTIHSPAVDSIAELTLYRSTADLRHVDSLDLYNQPIAKRVVAATAVRPTIEDTLLADNSRYFYYIKARLRNGRIIGTATDPVVTAARALPANIGRSLSLFIDKCNYCLELQAGGVMLKRYPVNAGSNPFDRKLHFDCRSTPEGRYFVTYRRPHTDYHCAFGVSYPNATDRKRYAQAIRNGSIVREDGTVPPIGGSIQIHGGGIGGNWTWGCLAMRNDDLDELFAQPGIDIGTPITIVGYSWTRDSAAAEIR